MYKKLNEVVGALNRSDDKSDNELADSLCDVLDVIWYRRLTNDERNELHGIFMGTK